MSMRTPLGRVRGLGSARDGTGHFWRQRVTAVANVPLTLFLVVSIIAHVGAGYEEMRAFVAQPLVAVLFLALVASAVVHMRLGMQVIIEDYVHGEGLKFACIMANTFFAAAVGLGAGFAILKIGFGG